MTAEPSPDKTPPADETSDSDSSESKSTKATAVDIAAKLIQTLSIVIGVVLSVLSFNHARNMESHARTAEAEKRKAEAARPFLEIRQKLYLETVHAAAVLTNPQVHSEEEVKLSRQRFRDLYVAELSLVEGFGVESHMRDLAEVIDPELLQMTRAQIAAFELAHALRDSLKTSWQFDEAIVDNPN
jgi:hypothetical protein